jgi:RNA-dependent RNA polymerase
MLLSVDYIYRLLITLDSSTAFQLTIIFLSELLLFLHTMDIKALHFGYQISKQNFSVLWKQEDVYVDFNLEKRKWFFFLSYLSEAYKLEISFDSIWQIKLHRPRGQSTMFLLLQVN